MSAYCFYAPSRRPGTASNVLRASRRAKRPTVHSPPQPSTMHRQCIYLPVPRQTKLTDGLAGTTLSEPRRQSTRCVQPSTCRGRRVLISIGCRPSRLFFSTLVLSFSSLPSLLTLPHHRRGTAVAHSVTTDVSPERPVCSSVPSRQHRSAHVQVYMHLIYRDCRLHRIQCLVNARQQVCQPFQRSAHCAADPTLFGALGHNWNWLGAS